LPGPGDKGPYPTVIEYSGYSPAESRSRRSRARSSRRRSATRRRHQHARHGLFRRVFQLLRATAVDRRLRRDETIAAQPWVAHHKVGLVGLFVPAISELFVAQLRPPELAANRPLSVIDDSLRGLLRPGGILNSGFVLGWNEGTKAKTPARARRAVVGIRSHQGRDKTCLANRLATATPHLIQEIKGSADGPTRSGSRSRPSTS